MILSELSPTELNKMTKAGIIAAVLEGATRVSVSLEQREDGESLLLEETTTDAYGVLLDTRTVEWSYYVTGEVKNITVIERDAEGKATGYVVKHPKAGQPTLAKIGSVGPIPIER